MLEMLLSSLDSRRNHFTLRYATFFTIGVVGTLEKDFEHDNTYLEKIDTVRVMYAVKPPK